MITHSKKMLILNDPAELLPAKLTATFVVTVLPVIMEQ